MLGPLVPTALVLGRYAPTAPLRPARAATPRAATPSLLTLGPRRAAPAVVMLLSLLLLLCATALAPGAAPGCANDAECLQLGSALQLWRCRESNASDAKFCALDCCYNKTSTCACMDQQCVPLLGKPSRPKNKQYLVIGDSVSMGYLKSLEAELAQKAYEVVHAPGNNDNTNWGRKCVQGWLGPDPSRWDVISINFGLHDLAFPDNEHLPTDLYSKFLQEIFLTLRMHANKARILWVTTTPVPTNPPPKAGKSCVLLPGRLETDVLRYNVAARHVLDGSDVPICDLHGFVTDFCGVGYSSCNITQCGGPHFSEAGFSMLGQKVAECVESL